MKTHDANTEAQLIRAVMDTDSRALILSQVDAEYFGSEVVLEIFRRIQIFINAGKAIPSSVVFRNDETLTEPARALLAVDQTMMGPDDIGAALEILKKYRKARILFHTINEAVRVLQGDQVDIDNVVTTMETMLQRCHTGNDVSEMKHYTNAEADELSAEITDDLRSPNDQDFIPTGIKQIDDTTGGFRKKNVVVLGSVPGGGKSALALWMAANQFRAGANVCYINYEMDEVELRYRLLASLSRVDHSEINLKRLTKRKIDLIDKRFREFLAESSNGNRFTIWTPARDLTMQQIGMELKPMGYDIVYVDYISLLRPTDPKKAQHEILGDHARAAKLVANGLDATIVLLAQYDDESNKIKYSKAIQANANLVWAWDHGEKEKESGVINVRQLKSRNSALFNFMLAKDFSTFTFQDYIGPDLDSPPPPPEEAEEEAPRGIPRMPELKL